MPSLWDSLRNLAGRGPGAAGPPGAGARASSFHLFWDLHAALAQDRSSHARLAEVSATLEVLVPPRVEALYFWALQVDMADDRGVWGGGHTGLQWNRRYPGGTAVNWGGYASAELGGGVLPGTTSALAGFADDPNTLAYPWRSLRAYRFRVRPSPEVDGAWRAEVTDLGSGEGDVIRDLLPPRGRGSGAASLLRPVMWSEVFADCDAPSVTVRWSDLQAVDDSGLVHRPETLQVNYQSPSEGGCQNTTMALDERGVLQITASERLIAQGSRLTLPSAGS